MAKATKPHFEVHPSVVFQLGESLITDAIQAVIELVKNCYDADASYAKVIIDTLGKTELPESTYPAAGGRIIVEDDGHGMGLEEVQSGWLLISNRAKRDLKEARKTTPGGRTPLVTRALGGLACSESERRLKYLPTARRSIVITSPFPGVILPAPRL